MRAAIYCRISRDAEGRGEGVERQEQDSRALAERHGFTVARVYVDNDLGASTRSRRPRPEYDAMVAAARNGDYDAIVAYSNSRLSRRPREWLDIIELAEKYGVKVHTVVSGSHDLSTADGRAVAQTIAVWDAAEAERTGERVKRAFDQRAEQGRPHGQRAYGWRRVDGHDVLDPHEAEVIREAARRIIAGESLRAICADFNRRGIPGSRVERWGSTPLRQILTRERNAGRRVHRGKVIGMGDWEPILDNDTFDRVVAILNDPVRRKQQTGFPRRYLVSGIATCGKCGGRVRGNAIKGKVPDYICPSCFGVRRSAPMVDDLVEQLVLGRLAMPDAPRLFGGDPEALEAARNRLETIRARMATAADQYADGAITADQLARITARLRTDERVAEADVRAAQPLEVMAEFAGDHAADAWAAASLEQRREVVRILMDVTVLPVGSGNRPGPESVRMKLRG